MTGSPKTLVLATALAALTWGCDSIQDPSTLTDLRSGSGVDIQMSNPEVVDSWTSVNLWTNGVPGDLSMAVLEDGTVVVDAVIDAQIYNLTLENDRMVVEVSDGFDVRVTTAAFVREDDTVLLADAFEEFPEMPDRPLGYPFDGNTSHEVALTTLSVLAEDAPELQDAVDIMVAATLSLESLKPEDSEDEKADPDSAQAEVTPTGRSGNGGTLEGGSLDNSADPQCAGEERVIKSFHAGPTLSLDAGPVSVSMTAVEVEGTSLCHPRFSPVTIDSGSFTSQYDPDGGSAAGCSSKYESAYTTSGSKTAQATNGACCFADGATDSAELGAFKASVFGKGFNLTGNVATASSDMMNQATATISGTATICIDFDLANEAMLMSSATTSATCN